MILWAVNSFQLKLNVIIRQRYLLIIERTYIRYVFLLNVYQVSRNHLQFIPNNCPCSVSLCLNTSAKFIQMNSKLCIDTCCSFSKVNICFTDSNARELSIDPIPDRASWWIKKEIPFSFSYYLIEARLRHWLPTRPQMAAPDAGKIILWILIYSVFHFSIVARTVTSASNYNYFLRV